MFKCNLFKDKLSLIALISLRLLNHLPHLLDRYLLMTSRNMMRLIVTLWPKTKQEWQYKQVGMWKRLTASILVGGIATNIWTI